MKKITAYQSEDGKTFGTREECRRHETRVMLQQQINRYPLSVKGKSIDREDVVDWIMEHSSFLYNIFHDYNMEEANEKEANR